VFSYSIFIKIDSLIRKILWEVGLAVFILFSSRMIQTEQPVRKLLFDSGFIGHIDSIILCLVLEIMQTMHYFFMGKIYIFKFDFVVFR